MPPAPPAENRRVAASPASVIWYEVRQSSALAHLRRHAGAAEDAAEQRDVGGERQHVEAQRDRDPDRVGVLDLAQRVLEPGELRAARGRARRGSPTHDEAVGEQPPAVEQHPRLDLLGRPAPRSSFTAVSCSGSRCSTLTRRSSADAVTQPPSARARDLRATPRRRGPRAARPRGSPRPARRRRARSTT